MNIDIIFNKLLDIDYDQYDASTLNEILKKINIIKKQIIDVISNKQSIPLDNLLDIYQLSDFPQKLKIIDTLNARNIKHTFIIDEIPDKFRLKLTDDILLQSKFKSLKKLNASGNNNITDKSISKLINLEELHIDKDNKHITNLSIDKLINLHELHVTDNTMIYLNNIKLPNLKLLYLTNINNNHDLSKLNITNLYLINTIITKLPKSLKVIHSDLLVVDIDNIDINEYGILPSFDKSILSNLSKLNPKTVRNITILSYTTPYLYVQDLIEFKNLKIVNGKQFDINNDINYGIRKDDFLYNYIAI